MSVTPTDDAMLVALDFEGSCIRLTVFMLVFLADIT